MYRNTYLGNPYVEGKGTSEYIKRSGSFVDEMKGLGKTIVDQQNKKKDEAQKIKEANAKAVDDSKVDFAIQHQQYFSKRVADMQQKALDLITKGKDLRKLEDPDVAAWQKEKMQIQQDAALSQQMQKTSESLQKLTDAQRDMFTPRSYADVFNFTINTPFEKQLEMYKNGEAPYLKSIEPFAPIESAASKLIANYSKNNAKDYYMGDDPALKQKYEEKYKADEETMRKTLRGMIKDSESVFYTAASKDEADKMADEWVEGHLTAMKELRPDLAKQKTFELLTKKQDETERHNRATEDIGYKALNLNWAKFNEVVKQNEQHVKGYWDFIQKLTGSNPAEVDGAIQTINTSGMGTVWKLDPTSGQYVVDYTKTFRRVKGKDINDPNISAADQDRDYIQIIYKDASGNIITNPSQTLGVASAFPLPRNANDAQEATQKILYGTLISGYNMVNPPQKYTNQPIFDPTQSGVVPSTSSSSSSSSGSGTTVNGLPIIKPPGQ